VTVQVVQDTSATVRIGEIVATSIAEFEAQTVQLHESPPLGALVQVRDGRGSVVYGVVASVRTDGIETGVRPIPRGRDGCEDADVFRDNPDLAFVLRTCFQCIVVGFGDETSVYQHLPNTPAPMHYSVLPCSEGACARFSRRLAYFRLILAARSAPAEEVLAAHIRFLSATRREPFTITGDSETPAAFCVRAGREVATLLRGDHQRTTAILQSIRPAVV
jgi:hypothetical protein